MENFSIFKTINILSSNICNEKLKTLIFIALELIYINNYSNIISKFLLNSIKECFYELKQIYDKFDLNYSKYYYYFYQYDNHF